MNVIHDVIPDGGRGDRYTGFEVHIFPKDATRRHVTYLPLFLKNSVTILYIPGIWKFSLSVIKCRKRNLSPQNNHRSRDSLSWGFP